MHLDKHLNEAVLQFGVWTYAIIFLIIFCETGLVFLPILPGDSLLFAIGALAALGSLDLKLCMLVMLIAAVIGDGVNYHVGKFIGPKVFEKQNSKVFKKEYLEKTESFFRRYGGKTIILARFVPIVRTFAPFLSGVGRMNYGQFLVYNVVGAVLWVVLLTTSGYLFGELPFVKNNFSLVVLGIVFVSFLPAIVEGVKSRTQAA